MKKILNVIAGVAKKAAAVALSLVGKGVSLGPGPPLRAARRLWDGWSGSCPAGWFAAWAPR